MNKKPVTKKSNDLNDKILMGNIVNIILKIRWLIILLVVAVTLMLAYQIPKIRINSDVISSLPDSDPDAVLLKNIGARFGGNNTGIIIIEAENIFTAEVLQHVMQVTDTLLDTEGVSSVTSLTNIMDVKSDENGLEIGKLVDTDNLPDSEEELLLLKEKVLSHDNYKGTIVSEDGTATLILFSLEENDNLQTLANKIKDKTESLRLPEKIYFAGSPMLITSISELIAADLKKLLPIAFFFISLVLYIGFRSVRGIILPLLTAVISIIWVLGIMSLAGSEVTMVSNNIPIVLLAVGTAYAIHVVNRIDQLKEDLNQSIIIALTYVTIPVILAALTTIAGFLSFLFGSYLTMIRDFGIYSALGTFIALLLSIFFVPALISAFSWENKKKNVEAVGNEITFYSRFIHLPLHKLLFSHAKRVLIVWIGITLVSLGGLFLIKRNVDVRNYFKKENPARIAEDIMTDKFGGSKPVFVLFKGDIQSPELLKTMLETEEYMKKSPGVETTQSVAGLIADISEALGEGNKIPEAREQIEQIWFLLEGNENLKKFVSEDLDEAIIISKFLSPENKEKKEFKEYMEKFISERSNEDCKISVTGMPFIESTMDRSLVSSQIGSLIIAVIFVIIVVGFILRSFMAGIFAAIPVITTIIILFGFMGYANISLNIATVLVASIAMGIGIDYSIHVISHFNSHINEGASVSEALDQTIAVSGKAIIINVISVSAGFLVLLFSEMVPLEYFGLLISLSMAGSGLSTLTLLPVILILAREKRVATGLVNKNV